MTDHPALSGAHEAEYAGRVSKQIPGLGDMHLMAGLLLAEHVPTNGRVLVLGAGGGLELKAFAQLQPDWQFDGVDPSDVMLNQAHHTLGSLASRVRFHEGYIDDAPDGPYDGAACLLTLHFLPEAERRRTVTQMAKRLKRGAPLVVMHHSFPPVETDKWLSRYSAFTNAKGASPIGLQQIGMMKRKLPVLSPNEDEAVLRDAGFEDIDMFYTAFTFKGWVCKKV
ncbi:class I SAM-dependent methyltransferase [Ahrensia sp. 13_GOM-1096m]|uniref:class I SAM-dependent methyltransferase n=1 Tax=Ahrensia sp. 13_GOM-1096m TaxID=1380380 RepID=UPI00047B48B2|nr:class I SAM-dependent methyltransferase [Ahrensia sp. 13_GOM-1096m]